jgi:UDP-2,3-diacylglucosamine hydrolase
MTDGLQPLPVFYEWAAPAEWAAIDLVSDLHLGPDSPRTFEAFAAHLMHTSADAVLILGDLFDVWVGDDALQRPFEQRCIDSLATASRRCTLGLMVGNRDFLIGARMLCACGAQELPDPTVLSAWSRRLLLTHGDALCIEDHAYQALRRVLRSDAWRAATLARPLAERDALARELRRSSANRKRGQPDPELWADVDATAAAAWLHGAGATEMIHGHTHRPGSHALASGLERHVLSDWDLDSASPHAEVLRLTRAGTRRVPPADGA